MPQYLIDDSNLYHIYNGLDELGRILNLSRLPGEENGPYRDRLESVYTHPGNARYDGLVYAINLALGYQPQEVMTISTPADTLSRISLQDQTLILTSGSSGFSFFLRETAVQTLTDLVQAINDTNIFTADLLDDVDGDAFSFGLVNSDSYVWQLSEVIPASHLFALQYAPVVPGTIVFDEGRVFARYLSPPQDSGDFSLDSTTGQVQVISLPSGQSRAAYQYYAKNLTLSYLPVAVSNLNSLPLRNWMFTKMEHNVWNSPSERYSQYQPYPLMQGIIDELKQNCPNFWDGWRWDEGRWLPSS
jgi:hypothetical protein